MIVGLLTMSILSGQVISRTGRYRAFPIGGTVLMTAGLALLSTLTVSSSTVTSSVYLLILGLGLGSTMQVLVLAAQNAVDYSLLGAATSGITLARGIGGSLGAATFGTIFSTRLGNYLHSAAGGRLARVSGGGTRLTGAQVKHLPAAARSLYQHAYVHALSPVFLTAAGVAAVGFALAWLLPERPLREAAATSTGLEDGLAAPRSPDSLAEIERSLARVTGPDVRRRFAERIAERAGIEISPGATWALVRIEEHGTGAARRLAEEQGVAQEQISIVIAELSQRELIGNDGSPGLTAKGRELAERALAARRELLCEAIADETAERDPKVQTLLQRLARELAGEPPLAAAS
jgi:DNA-binding MarR family transcriptional regulator